jgi:hypothetical protein
MLRKGDSATITAAGRAYFGTRPINAVSPEGIPRGSKCERVTARQGRRAGAWPAPTLNCWSLIGRIGSGRPFPIGKAATVRADAGGELSVGVNDNFLIDNKNGWTVTIRRSPAPPASTTPAPTGNSSKSSNFVLLAAVGLAAIVVLVLVALLLRRRRARQSEVVAPAPASVPTRTAPAPVSAAATAIAGAAAATNVMMSPVEGESTAGNILEVTLAGGSLLVGYNHFPEGTIVHWRISQNAAVMTGQFETDGRSAAQQDVTVPLESELDGANPADIAFAWSVGGVAFNYAVRRNPEPETQT